jgi:hypothetical protein
MSNEYKTAEVVEIGRAEEVILGSKEEPASDDGIFSQVAEDFDE